MSGLSLLWACLGAFAGLLGVCVVQSCLLSEQEQAALADAMDEFLCGDTV